MHGNGYRYQGNSGYAISVNDGEGKTLYMNATGAGLWQVICHVSCVPSYLLLGIARGGVPGWILQMESALALVEVSRLGVLTWCLRRQVNFHQTLGMLANYNVYYPGECPPPPLAGNADEA